VAKQKISAPIKTLGEKQTSPHPLHGNDPQEVHPTTLQDASTDILEIRKVATGSNQGEQEWENLPSTPPQPTKNLNLPDSPIANTPSVSNKRNPSRAPSPEGEREHRKSTEQCKSMEEFIGESKKILVNYHHTCQQRKLKFEAEMKRLESSYFAEVAKSCDTADVRVRLAN
jgi:hypothetical protein